jgi:molecular chaperone GrpE
MMPKEPEEKENKASAPLEEPKAETPKELPEATITPEEALAEEKKRAEEYLASWQRSQADFINYKRRSEQERLDFNSFANANLVLSILPVLDDLERAIKAIPEEFNGHDWVEGIKLVERKFKTTLEGQGVKPILALGMAFDPKLHEAIRHEKGKEGMVIAEYQKGYTLNGKLLRPSHVAVGKGTEESTHKVHPKEEKEEHTHAIHHKEEKEGTTPKIHPNKDEKEESTQNIQPKEELEGFTQKVHPEEKKEEK